MTVPNARFNIFSGALKSYEAPDGRKRLKTVASSTIVDHSGDRMTENAIRKMADSARNNMTIFLNHSYAVPEDVFGSVEDVAINHRDEYFDLDFDIVLNDTNPRAVQAWEAINKGTKLGTSIGAVIRDGYEDKDSGGYVFDDVELLEASIVGIPANPRSWVQYAVKALQADTEKATTWVDVSSDGKVSVVIDDEETKSADPDDRKEIDADKREEEGETPTDSPAESTNADNQAEASDPEINTEPATQEAQKSAPESVGESDPERVPPLDGDLGELTGLTKVFGLLEKTTGELVATRKALGDEQAAHAVTKAKLRAAREDHRSMQAVIERVASLPIGRRASFGQEVETFRARFAGLYDDDFLKMLEKNNDG